MARVAPLFVIAGIVGCAPAPVRETIGTFTPGLAMTVYMRTSGHGAVTSVDDRHYVQVRDGAFDLIDIDPAIALSSLMLESPTLTIGPCTRERTRVVDEATTALERHDQDQTTKRAKTPESDDEEDAATPSHDDTPAATPSPPSSPPAVATTLAAASTVHCRASGGTGRQLVRVGYVTPALAMQAQHDVDITGDVAHVVTRIVLKPPPRKLDGVWQQAEVSVFDGEPGGATPASLIAHGRIVLDGALATIEGARRDVRVHVRRVFEIRTIDVEVSPKPIKNLEDVFSKDDHDERNDVWVVAELPATRLVIAPVRVHMRGDGRGQDASLRDIDVGVDAVNLVGDTLRLSLWVDRDLVGTHERSTVPSTGTLLEERSTTAITNRGSVAREVWVEQAIRPARRRAVVRASPSKPSRVGDVLRSKLTVAPNGRERVGYTVIYDL